ncbi:hypothetical protein [Glycomyces xiaoerkulensis]|nr:hypothetical protein [Glycomyces xiaoerkulensis]
MTQTADSEPERGGPTASSEATTLSLPKPSDGLGKKLGGDL